MKSIDHDAMDVALANIADNGNMLHLLSQAPASYSEVVTYSLGSVALTPGDGNGSYTIQAGAISGRRLSVAQQVVPGTADGIATHAAIVDTTNQKIKQITTAPNYNMFVEINQSVPAFDAWEIEDPT